MIRPIRAVGPAALACLPILFAAPVQAQSTDCITPSESQAVVAYLMPELVRRVEARCTPLLGGGGFLAGEADALAQRVSPLSEASGPLAIRALERQSGTALPDNAVLLSLGRQALAEGVAQQMDDTACRAADRLMAELDPLPPRNLANLVALAIETGLNSDPDSPIKVCPAP
ncbi:MAG: hypothetical protein AAF311_06920 [Pseudomonadota bacterium]